MSSPAHNPSIEDRFPTSVSSGPPTQEQRAASAGLRDLVVTAASYLDALPNTRPRDKAIAMTAFEDALMRGNRAIFNPPKEH